MRARENPFRTERIGSLAFRHPVLSVDGIRERLAAQGERGAIVGPKGSGKTTLLRELGRRLAGEGLRLRHWFLAAESPLPPTGELVRQARALGPQDALLFDGAGHLTRPAFWRVQRASRRAGALLVTAHGAAGLPTLVETGTDAALLGELCRELVGEPWPGLAPLLEELRAGHRGNLRDVFLALYDLAARDDARLAGIEVGQQARRARSERKASEVGQQARRARSERKASEVGSKPEGRAASGRRAKSAARPRSRRARPRSRTPRGS